MANTRIQAETTPNPQSMRFSVDREIATETVTFSDAKSSSRSPLAEKLFGFPWVSAVLIGPHFITITKQDWVDWEMLTEPLIGLLGEHLDSDLPVLKPAVSSASTGLDDSEIVIKIKAVLDTEIRPTVALDGGDVSFERFEDGKLFIAMHGACSGCPSATFTLKEGIETRLREVFPEITEVISI